MIVKMQFFFSSFRSPLLLVLYNFVFIVISYFLFFFFLILHAVLNYGSLLRLWHCRCDSGCRFMCLTLLIQYISFSFAFYFSLSLCFNVVKLNLKFFFFKFLHALSLDKHNFYEFFSNLCLLLKLITY